LKGLILKKNYTTTGRVRKINGEWPDTDLRGGGGSRICGGRPLRRYLRKKPAAPGEKKGDFFSWGRIAQKLKPKCNTIKQTL